MKIFRSLAAVLSVCALGHLAPAQESSEVASLRAKAEKGNGIAQYNLGLAYADGKGIARDPIEAYVWLSLARESGARGRALDNVVASLDKASLELARQRIAERKTALGKPAAATTAAKPATPAPVIVVDTQPATPEPTGSTGTAEDPVLARLRKERDAYSTKVGEIAADLFTVRSERDRLAEQAAEIQRNTQAASAASLSLQEQLRAAEARAAELERTQAATTAELERTRQELAALAAAPKPAPDTAALEAKSRELQAALTELEAARQFGRQVEDTLNKVNDDRARVAANAAAELEAARQFGRQVEDTLNKVNDQKAALESQLAMVTQAKTAAPGYPDLSGRVHELETALAAAQNAKPAYPNLADRVRELEAQRSSDLSAAASAKAEATRAKQELAALSQAKEETRKSTPAYPDLRERVAELESQFAASQATAKTRTEELARANIKLAGDETTFAALSAEAGRAKQEIMALAKAKEEVNRELAAAKTSLAQANQALAAKPTAPAYPNLTDRVRELEAQRSSDLSAIASATAEAARDKQEIVALTKAKEDKPATPAYPDLRQQVGDLETKLAATEKALAAKPAAPSYPDLSGRVSELESQLAQANTDLSAVGSAKVDLSDRVRELEAVVATSIQKFGAAEQGRIELARQFDDYKSATAAAQRERTTLQATLKMLESDKAALRRQVDAATTESNQLRTQVAALKTQASAPRPAGPNYPDLSGRVGELESQLAKVNTDLSAAGSAKTDLSGKVAELAAALQGAQTQIGTLTAEREAARTAQNELRDTVTRLTREKTEQTAIPPAAPSYPDLSGRVSELETALAAARNAPPASPDLTSRVGELESQLARTQIELSAAGSAKADLTGRVNDLTAEVTQLRTDRERMQKLLADSGRQLTDLSAEASRAKQDVGALTKAKEEATAAARSRPAAPDLSGRVRELEAALAQAKATPAAPAYPDLSGEVVQLRTDRERMQKMLADAGRQLRDNTADTARIKELEAQLAVLSADSSAVALAKAEAARAKQEVAALTQAKEDARNAQNDLRDTIARLEREKAGLASAKPIQAGAPAYPDLSGRVSELESALVAAKQQLAQAQSASAPAATTAGDTSGLEQKLADTEDRLATALRGYAALQHERDALAENAAKSAAAVTAERDALAGQVASLTGQVEQLRASAQGSESSTQAELARLGAAVASLQRTTAQASSDLAAARALTQQLQGANSVLAGENYQLKTMLTRAAGGPAPAVAPATTPAARLHVVVAGDSLSRLSQRYYGTAGRWQEIYNANAPLLGPNGVLRVGTELRIP